MTSTHSGPVDWDRPANAVKGFTDQHLLVYYPTGELIPVGVPGGTTPREFAEILHGFDGHTVKGFGYEPDDEHPANCRLCKAAEPMVHNYEPEAAE